MRPRVGVPQSLLIIAIAAHIVMVLSLFFGFLNPLFDNSDLQPKGIDFFSIYQGGVYALDNHPIYSWDVSSEVPYSAPYRYLPFFAYTVAAAFTVLPPWTGYWLWVALNELMLFMNAWLTFRVAPDRRWGFIAAGMWFAFTPLYLELYMGQWSFLMATLMLLTAIALVRGQEFRAGAPWITSIMVKTNSAILGPIFLRAGYWRVLVVAGCLLVALNAPYFIARPGEWDLFARLNLRGLWFHEPITERQLASGDLGGVAWLQTVWFALDPDGTGIPTAVKRAYVILIVAGSFFATFLPRRMDRVATFAIWLSAYFLAYISVWEHHYVMLLPPLVALVALRPRFRPVALVTFAFVAIPTPYAIIEHTVADAQLPAEELRGFFGSPQLYWPAWAGVWHHSAKTLPVFALWSYLLIHECFRWARDLDPPDDAGEGEDGLQSVTGDGTLRTL